LDAAENAVFENTHETLMAILTITPLAGREALLKYTKECIPYCLHSVTRDHTNYITNLLRITKYFASDRLYFLTLVTDRLVQLDAHIDKELLEDELGEASSSGAGGVEQMSVGEARRAPHLIARTNLDEGMNVFIKYVDDHLDDVTGLKSLYLDLVKVFESHVLPAHTGHVQFILFYVLAKRPAAFTAHFLDLLWTKFQSPNTPSVIRQATMSYIASLTSRAKYVGTTALLACLEKITGWIHSYINSTTASSVAAATSTKALACHGHFYAACQAVFYMFAFRHEELVTSKRHLSILRSLHFNTIVTSRLNPLYFCLYQVVRNFSAVTRNYQLAYCETIIQRNSRISLPVVDSLQMALSSHKADAAATNNILDSFFPFDPYRLPCSKHSFQEHFREYHGGGDEEDEEEADGGDEIDDHEESSISGNESDDENDDDDDEGEEESEDETASHYHKDTSKNNEIDTFLMEIESMESPSPKLLPGRGGPKAKRRRTDSMVSVGSIDFEYGSSPGFRH